MKKNLKRTLSVMLVLVMMIPIFAMPADAADYSCTGYVNTSTYPLNVRCAPSTNAQIIGSIPMWAPLTVLDNNKKTNGFYHVTYKNLDGYASSEYIQIYSSTTRTIKVKAANFSDISTNAWSYKFICYVNDCGYMNGTGNNCFSPNGTITKGEVDIVLKRVKGLNPTWQANSKIYTRNDTVYAIWQNAGYPYASKSVVNKYSDSWRIPENYKQAWAWCINKGIINGTSNTTLSPLDKLTREQFATLICRYDVFLHIGLSPYEIVVDTTMSVSNNIVTLNGVKLYEYPLGSTVPSSSYYFNVNGNSTYVAATQCYGYACYVETKLYGSCYHTNSSHFPNLSGSVNVYPNESELKSLITRAGTGAHLRTGPSSTSPGHSMIIANITSTGFTVIDANADGKCTVQMRTYTWNGYINSYLGQRGIAWIEVHT